MTSMLRFQFVLLSLLMLAGGRTGYAQNGDEAEKLPLRRVVLFNSGVGFFEHRGTVTGNDEIELRFKIEDVNDLLKSMVLQDEGGGRVSTVSYGSRDPITKTLKSFAIDLTSNPTLADLLAQVRGEQVEIDVPDVKGKIVGIERRQQPAGDDATVEVAYLNLLTVDGLRSISLQSVGRIKLANPQLDAELRAALATLAAGNATDKKSVTLKFLGEGERPVRVGYIQETPVWKTSYRLVLGEEEPLLQGWAVVENTSDSDWQNVSLALISGRPISFVMDLYSPLYAPRPVVEPELYASLRPPQYDQDLSARDKAFRREAAANRARQSPSAPATDARRKLAARFGGAAKADEKQMADRAALATAAAQRGSVQSLASASEVGELFEYRIDTPVTLARQRSAMLPIVNDSVEARQLSIYNADVHAKHPLNAVRLENSTELHLMQGPVTVFADGVYAGDARLPDLPPGSERLVSYAMDLDVEVAQTSSGKPEELVSVKVDRGTLHTSHKQRRSVRFVVKNSGGKDKQVLIEYPLESAWMLIHPENPTEQTRDLYRFAVTAPSGEPETLTVEEERLRRQSVALTNLSEQQIAIYIRSSSVSEQVKAALEEVIRRKSEIAKVRQQRQQLEQEIRVVEQEQERIRKNMAALPRDADLLTRYIKKFTQQEDQVESLREKIRELTRQETKLNEELAKYLSSLNLE